MKSLPRENFFSVTFNWGEFWQVYLGDDRSANL